MSDYITGERLPKTMRKKVNEIIVDSPSDFFVWLNKPFAFEPHENEAIASHCAGFDGMRQIRDALKYVKVCPCQYCQA
jgi:hypothetical protein